MRLAQAQTREEQIRKMATLAKAEKTELMANKLKERSARIGDESADRKKNDDESEGRK